VSITDVSGGIDAVFITEMTTLYRSMHCLVLPTLNIYLTSRSSVECVAWPSTTASSLMVSCYNQLQSVS